MCLKNIGRWAVVAGYLAIVTGCATVNRGIPEKLEPTTGAVVLKVVAVQRLGIINAKWTRMTVVEQKSGQAVELVDTAALDAQHALFAQSLPAGNYTIKSLDAPGLAPVTFGIVGALAIHAMTSDQHRPAKGFGSFTVEPGTVTNLGLTVAAPPRDNEKQMALAVLADERAQASASADLDAASRRNTRDLRTRSWDKAPEATQLDRALDIVRTRTTYASPIEVTRDGRALIGTAMGLVHVRDAAGHWSTLPSSGLDTLGYVRELPDGRIFAGSYGGRYHLWDPATRSWTARRIADEGRIMQIEALGSSGYALLLGINLQLGQPTKLKLYQVADLAAADPAAREVLSLDGGFPALGAMPIMFDGRELLAIFNHVGITRSADVYRIDPASLQQRREKQSHWTGRFYRLADNTLVRDRVNGMSVYSDMSTDNGATWKLTENSNGLTACFTSRTAAYGLSFVSMGMKSSTFSLAKTTDAGKTWVNVGKPFDSAGEGNPLQLVLLPDNRPLVYTGAQVMSTPDEGATWVVEWPLAR